ncbi:hypothetical protein FB451DRAFT_1184265 [Mycena latifolia]|nr:hypothetical protein FB451DRAFT_1184265 [Mycena latifolia]
MVASNWTETSQTHLFSTVTLDSLEKTKRLPTSKARHIRDLNITLRLDVQLLSVRDNRSFSDHCDALIPILIDASRIHNMGLACGRNYLGISEFYLPAWFVHALGEVIGRNDFKSFTLVNWDFPNLEIIPLTSQMQKLAFITCRFSLPSGAYTCYPGNETIAYTGIMTIGTLDVIGCADLRSLQKWTNKSTRTTCLCLSGMEKWPLVPALLTNVQCIEIEIEPSCIDTDGFSLNNLGILEHARCEYIGLSLSSMTPQIQTALIAWLSGLRLRSRSAKQTLRLQMPPHVWEYVEEAIVLNRNITLVACNIMNNSLCMLIQADIDYKG